MNAIPLTTTLNAIREHSPCANGWTPHGTPQGTPQTVKFREICRAVEWV